MHGRRSDWRQAGGPGEPVTLTMATVNGDLDFTPQIQYLLDRAAQVSEGNVQIEVVFEVGDFAPDAEQQVVNEVADGEFDLGYVGTQGFEALGAENFVALTAPMLIDSYALEDAVIESGVTDQMLQGLEGDRRDRPRGPRQCPAQAGHRAGALSSAPPTGRGSRSEPSTRRARRRRSSRSTPPR